MFMIMQQEEMCARLWMTCFRTKIAGCCRYAGRLIVLSNAFGLCTTMLVLIRHFESLYDLSMRLNSPLMVLSECQTGGRMAGKDAQTTSSMTCDTDS